MDTISNEDLPWRTPSGCPNGPTCVEIAELPGGGVAVRDGKDPDGPVLRFEAAEWASFLAAAKAGEYDPPPPVPAQPN